MNIAICCLLLKPKMEKSALIPDPIFEARGIKCCSDIDAGDLGLLERQLENQKMSELGLTLINNFSQKPMWH